jgi:uncharacterized damage-inducible protein DinB
LSTVPKEVLLAEFDHEMAVTRRMLERLPAPALSWRPHPRSRSLGQLASHIAAIPRWGSSILERDGYDVGHDRATPEVEPETPAAIVSTFDAHTAQVRRALVERADVELDVPWSLTRGSRILMSMPRFAAFRSFLLYHLVHHRGQLSVYLRLQDVPLPPLYGATADEAV